MLADSDIREDLYSDHNVFPGAWLVSRRGSASRVTHVMLPTMGKDNRPNCPRRVFAVTTSNKAAVGQTALVIPTALSGNTIRLLTESFAKTLPANGFHIGKGFTKTTAEVDAAIRDLLPEDNTSYCLALVPNAAPILGGAQLVPKGPADECLVEHFAEISPHHVSWLNIQFDLDQGVLPFSSDLQALVVSHKVDLPPFYNASDECFVSETPYVTLLTAPPDDDDEDTINIGIAKMHATLARCVERNRPIPRRSPSRMEISLPSRGQDDDLLSPPSANSNERAARASAKLRLMCMGWSKDKGVFLFDLKEDVAKCLNSSLDTRAESMQNLLQAQSSKLQDTQDFLDRFSEWPPEYKSAT